MLNYPSTVNIVDLQCVLVAVVLFPWFSGSTLRIRVIVVAGRNRSSNARWVVTAFAAFSVCQIRFEVSECAEHPHSVPSAIQDTV